METTADLYIFIGTAVTFFTFLAIFGKEKGEREMEQRRAAVRTDMTQYQKRQAQMALSAETIRKGHE